MPASNHIDMCWRCSARERGEPTWQVALVPALDVRREVPRAVALAVVVAPGRRSAACRPPGSRDAVEADVLVRLAHVERAVALGAERVAQVVIVVVGRIGVRGGVVAGLVLVALPSVPTSENGSYAFVITGSPESRLPLPLRSTASRSSAGLVCAAVGSNTPSAGRGVAAVAERDHGLAAIRVELAIVEVVEHDRVRAARRGVGREEREVDAGRRVRVRRVVERRVAERAAEVARRLHVEVAAERQADAVARPDRPCARSRTRSRTARACRSSPGTAGRPCRGRPPRRRRCRSRRTGTSRTMPSE